MEIALAKWRELPSSRSFFARTTPGELESSPHLCGRPPQLTRAPRRKMPTALQMPFSLRQSRIRRATFAMGAVQMRLWLVFR